MRILMISPQFRPLIGGYERAAERLSAALVRRGLDVVVLTERRDPAWPAMERIDGFDVWRLPCRHRPKLHTVSSLLSFAGYLLRHGRKFDVWHVHQYGFHAGLAIALGKVLSRPVVLKVTNTCADGIGPSLGSGITASILGFFHRRVSACLAVTEETCAEAIRFGIPAQRVHLIPNGVDGRQFYPVSAEERITARRALELNCKKLVLYVGRLSPEKNPLGLLEAWAIIDAKSREGALLALVGDGPDRGRVRARAQAPNLMNAVHLAGQRSDVATWYRAADAYVISSQNEGLSNSMIEALASGLPVASTRVSGSSVLVESPAAGLVVEVGNITALAGAIETLLKDDSTRLRLGMHARLTFESRFSLESLSKKMILLYEDLVDRSQKRLTA